MEGGPKSRGKKGGGASGMSAKAIRALELKLIDEKIARERSTKATLLDTYETNKNSLAKLRAADSDEVIINRQLKLTAESGKNILICSLFE